MSFEYSNILNDPNPSKVVTLDMSKIPRNYTHYIGIFVWIGWFAFYLALFVSFPFLLMKANYVLTITLAVVAISAFTTVERKFQPKWGYDIGTWAMKKTAEYCHVKVVVEDYNSVKNTHPAVFAFEPHDLLPISMSSLNDSLQAIPGHKCLGCVSSACFRVPIMRHISTWVNACNADRDQVISLLSEGISPVLCPGGVREVMHIKATNEITLYLRNRLGFIRVAMLFGVAIIPIFAFGLRQCFDYSATPKSDFLLALSKKLGFAPVIFYGVWGIPFGPCKPCDLVNVIGRPIPVPKLADPSEEVVREYLDKYIREIERIFETNKQEFGMGQYQLHII